MAAPPGEEEGFRKFAGTGIEHALTKHLRARVEYLYDDYGSRDYTITGPFPYRADVSLSAHTIRLGLSYYF